ncbi:hypothetical protein GIY23_21415 [Allosaccharopolyspora coralli]|uniref:Uncharacterized protein n=1 Tax=Allosaccharopolyspora coralli TaxID=2665642 RepID=A0A5Q3QB85_9PSEU|nr:hypothetical protein [Allosaccharopolyspora coralli]QGK71732.1 hypothetical protein GIY23_21415 [Allosaccharopolyspora coralli]
MVDAKRQRRRHVSALGWAAGVTLLLGLLDTADLSQKPPHIHALWLLLIFVLAAGFWELVHLLTRDKLLARKNNPEG